MADLTKCQMSDEPSIGFSNEVPKTWDFDRGDVVSAVTSTLEVQEVEINAPSLGYQRGYASGQQDANPQSNEGNDSSASGSRSSSDNPASDVNNGSEAFSSPVEDNEPIRGDVVRLSG
ncbi:hypothetical protein HAX54_041892 [Datura stramonium]|uniref:Uncharacterized protein n=1 Tax=Datura stramonium TaxID=4076 RepID=A0ABS8W3A7_DATST|nr:hypothetical protein [Datura stramonium]